MCCGKQNTNEKTGGREEFCMLCHIYCTSFLSEKAVITKYFALDSNNHPLTAHQGGGRLLEGGRLLL